MKGFRLFPSLLAAFVLTLSSIGQAQAEITYYINDHLGSPIAAEDENGVLLWRERYSPFGDAQFAQKRDEETPGYTGKRYYGDLGLSYFGARWYDSTSGRFITPDPAGWQESSPYFSFNQYAYANNNPYVYTDPDGEFPFLIPVAIFLAKEIAGEIFERTTGVPAVFTVKGAGKAIFKQGRKLASRELPTKVIGRLGDTAVAKNWKNHDVLNIKEWTLKKNDQWIDKGIKNKQDFYIASPEKGNIYDQVMGRQTVFGREIDQIKASGYIKKGDYFIHPDKLVE